MAPTNSIIAKVNEVSIIIMDTEKLVPIKPICEALGVDYSGQLQKIKEDDILSSVVGLSPTTGKDNKVYEMTCLPLEYAFGWLFSINHKNVKPVTQEAVKQYKMECYHALYKHFTEYSDFMEERQNTLDEALVKMETIKENFKNAKTQLQEGQEVVNAARKMNFNDWKAGKNQMNLDFPTQD